MTIRSSLLMLTVGLLVGAAIGYAVGRWPAAPTDPVPLAAVPPPAALRTPVQPTRAGFHLSNTKPTEVSKGMTRAQATMALSAEGFEPWTDASVTDEWERFRKPWQGGYHFVNLRFGGEEVGEVGEFWNDP